MKVLFVSSEVWPFAKTGGLADVSGALPPALKKLGADIRIIMPRYKCVKAKGDEGVIEGVNPASRSKERGFTGDGVKVYFVKEDKFFDRANLYGEGANDYPDNLERFSFFAEEVLKRAKAENFKPDIIHCNDWQSALVPVYLRTIYSEDPFFKDTKTIFTIHNLSYQGIFPPDSFPKTKLGWELFTIHGLEYWGKINLMKGGILFSDSITTVSPGYRDEILTKEFGCGLEGVLDFRKNDLVGILNGIDYKEWNPAEDKDIFKKYSLRTLKDKTTDKLGLQKELKLKAAKDVPFIGIITRLAEQKGIDILSDVIESMMKLGIQFVLLGTGDEKYHKIFANIGKKFPKAASVNLKFDAVLAKKIYAGCDMFLMPSRFEPCGLGQMISLRYGTIPIVRSVGGLGDTIEEFNPKTGEGNGFTFVDYKGEELLGAIERALAVYGIGPLWLKLVKKGMQSDFSWERSAKEYSALYSNVAKRCSSNVGMACKK